MGNLELRLPEAGQFSNTAAPLLTWDVGSVPSTHVAEGEREPAPTVGLWPFKAHTKTHTVCLFFVFVSPEMGFLYVALAVMELTLDTKLSSSSEICLPLPPECWVQRSDHRTQAKIHKF